MICQECNKNHATMHFTKVSNGKKDEIHLCDHCAREKTNSLFLEPKSTISMHDLLSGILHFEPEKNVTRQSKEKDDLNCTECGLTYREFLQRGKFGCSNCYQDFSNVLDPIFKRLQLGNTKHVGKIPNGAAHIYQIKKDLSKLRIQLKDRVEKEEFEMAAVVRDQIKELESQIEHLRREAR